MNNYDSRVSKIKRIILLANELLKDLNHPDSSPSKKKERSSNPKKGPQFFIGELINEGFLKQGRSIELIRVKLQEEGQNYSQEDLGTPLRRLVQQKKLKREKIGSQYLYQERK